MSLVSPCRLPADRSFDFSRLPTEIWLKIVACVLQKTRPVALHDPCTLAECRSAARDEEVAASLALVCKFFYNILVPLLADHMKISNVAYCHLPGHFQRSTLGLASDACTPSTLSVKLTNTVADDTISLINNPSLRGVLSLRLERPDWWIEDTFQDYINELVTCIGPQIQTVYLLQSEEWWVIDDLVPLPLALPGLRHLHIADLRCHHDFDYNSAESNVATTLYHNEPSTTELHVASVTHSDMDQVNDLDDIPQSHMQPPDSVQDSNVADFASPDPFAGGIAHIDHGPIPILAFQHLEWLALGELSFIPRVLHPKEPRAFELILHGLSLAACPKLTRLDVLQYIGPLKNVLARYDTILQCLCLSTSAMERYASSLSACPSLTTLRIVIDSLLDIPAISHPSLSTISVYVPTALWSYSGRKPPTHVETFINYLFTTLRDPGLPSLQRVELHSEVPVPVVYLNIHRFLFGQMMGVEFVYVEVP